MRKPAKAQRLFDISPKITPQLAVWPTDTPMSRQVLLDVGRGDNLTLSTLRATVHLGAHADAPSHFAAGGQSIGERDLSYYLGPCQVTRVEVARHARIVPADLKDKVRAERLLLYTGTFPDPTQFNQDFAALSVDLIEALHQQGVRLIGIDTPSIDLFESKDLPAHHALLRCGMANLEGLVLDEVPPGLYELVALPLPLIGFDASPVRAVLR